VKVIGDRWSVLVLHDVMFGNWRTAPSGRARSHGA
jgi:hypothetical protein